MTTKTTTQAVAITPPDFRHLQLNIKGTAPGD
jgi:hypothetical protein